MDSDLEAFSRNPADGSFAVIAFQLAAFTKDVFINQERKLGDRRGLDTLVVLTINYAD